MKNLIFHKKEDIVPEKVIDERNVPVNLMVVGHDSFTRMTLEGIIRFMFKDDSQQPTGEHTAGYNCINNKIKYPTLIPTKTYPSSFVSETKLQWCDIIIPKCKKGGISSIGRFARNKPKKQKIKNKKISRKNIQVISGPMGEERVDNTKDDATLHFTLNVTEVTHNYFSLMTREKTVISPAFLQLLLRTDILCLEYSYGDTASIELLEYIVSLTKSRASFCRLILVGLDFEREDLVLGHSYEDQLVSNSLQRKILAPKLENLRRVASVERLADLSFQLPVLKYTFYKNFEAISGYISSCNSKANKEKSSNSADPKTIIDFGVDTIQFNGNKEVYKDFIQKLMTESATLFTQKASKFNNSL